MLTIILAYDIEVTYWVTFLNIAMSAALQKAGEEEDPLYKICSQNFTRHTNKSKILLTGHLY